MSRLNMKLEKEGSLRKKNTTEYLRNHFELLRDTQFHRKLDEGQVKREKNTPNQ